LSFIFTRFRDIAALVLQRATLFTTPESRSSPPESSPCSAVPLGVCGWPLCYEEWRCSANCPCN